MSIAGTANPGHGELAMGADENAQATKTQHLAPSLRAEVAPWQTVGCELAAEVLRSTGSLRLQVSGTSMIPAIWPGDILSVRGQTAAQSLPGEIVVFRRDGRLVTHRVVKRIGGPGGFEWITRGDRVCRDDAPVSSDDILGCVAAIERGSRQFAPRQSMAGRMAAWILSRSDLATGALLKIRGWVGGLEFRESGSYDSESSVA